MRTRLHQGAVAVAAGMIIAAGAVGVGRASVDTQPARDKGYQSGLDTGYFKGLLTGEVQGRREGRALQAGNEVPAGDRRAVRDAFDAGYVAGGNDVFAGYDGGWAPTPYVVSIVEGRGRVTYRISSREQLVAGVSYYLCANGRDLCQQPRH
jgi:hypothetical protein